MVLTSNEYASIAYDNPKELSEDEITNVIYDFKRINSEFKKQFITTKEDKPKISIINKYYLTNSRNHSRSADSIQINVPIFEVELTNNSGTKDMTIVCGDERAPKVLLFTENYQFSQPMNIDMRYLVEIAKLNILSDIKYIEKLKSEKRSSTLDKISQSLNISKEQITEDIIKRNITIIDNSNSREYNPINGIDISKIPSRIVSMVPPISDIVWHQEAPYNDQMPIGNIWDGHMGTYQGHYLVGCGNIAVATLFSILKPVMVGETAAGRQILIDWDYLTAQKTITYYSSPDLIEMTASLLRAIYNKTRSFPNYVDFNTYDEDNNPIIKRGIASTSTPTEGMLEYLQTMIPTQEAQDSIRNWLNSHYKIIIQYFFMETDTMLTTIVSLSQKIHTKTNRVMVGLLTDTVLPKNRVHQIVIYIGLSTWDGEKVLRPSILKQTTV